jgi:hypothetical protein
MTPFLWTASGIALGVAVLHLALGVRRPFERTYLSFACIMGSAAVFLYVRAELYSATTLAAVVDAQRRLMSVINVSFACMFVFVPAYTRVRIPGIAQLAYWAVLCALFVVNLRAPYSIWFSSEPQLVRSTFRGEPYTAVIAPPMGLAQYAYVGFALLSLIVGLAFSVKMFRRGDRQRALTSVIAVVVVLGFAIADVVRDSVGGAWPNVVEFGIVSWGLIMSVQLAYDFRTQRRALGVAISTVEAQSKRLTRILDALHALEQNMHIPLDTLESGVAGLARGSATEDQQLRRIERTVTRLREFARSMPGIRDQRTRRDVKTVTATTTRTGKPPKPEELR